MELRSFAVDFPYSSRKSIEIGDDTSSSLLHERAFFGDHGASPDASNTQHATEVPDFSSLLRKM